MNSKRPHEQGMGIIEIMVAAVIGILVVGAISTSLKKSSDFTKKIGTLSDLEIVKAQIASSIDCSNTFMTRTIGNPCPSQVNLDLVSKSGTTVAAANGSTVIGRWNVKPSCDPSGLTVKAALKNGGQFVKDEMNSNLLYDWDHPKALLFGARADGKPNAMLCEHWFKPPNVSAETSYCAEPGQFIKSINKTTGEPVCGTFGELFAGLSCEPGEVLEGFDSAGGPVCIASGGPDDDPTFGLKWQPTGNDCGTPEKKKDGTWKCTHGDGDKCRFDKCPDPTNGVPCQRNGTRCVKGAQNAQVDACRIFKCTPGVLGL